MASRAGIALAICLGIAAPATAQVVRFETTMGAFDMVLNPTNNARLEGHVDNMLQYVENGNYNGSWINRAPEGFVLQMGGLFSHTLRPPMTVESTRPVATFAPVEGEPATETGLSNTLGTVALALRGHPTQPGRSNQNSGTSSFFVNLGDNSFLDQDFTVFAAISNMTVINQIMDLMKRDLTDPARQPPFGASPGELTYSDVPVMDNGFQVFIKRAFVVTDAMTVAQAMAAIESSISSSTAALAASANSGIGDRGSPQSLSAAVPEPASIVMLLLAPLFLLGCRRARPSVPASSRMAAQ